MYKYIQFLPHREENMLPLCRPFGKSYTGNIVLWQILRGKKKTHSV